MSIKMVLEEMRGTFEAAKVDSDSIYALAIAGDARRWADTIEAARQEPVAYLMENKEYPHLAQSLHFSPPEWHITWTPRPLFALPPDAQKVIELEIEHSKLLVDEIERRDEQIDRLHGIMADETEGRNELIGEIERLKALLSEARYVIRDEVEDNYPWKDKYPMHMLRYKADMDIVRRIDAALNTEDKP